MYDMYEIDLILIGGDFNARMGKMKDYIPDLDNAIERRIIDETQNDHGKLFNDFLLQTKMCIVNGRVNPLQDNYMSISHKGKAVVDYFVTEYSTFDNITDFEVITMADAIQRYNLHGEAEGRVSEHSILKICINLSHIEPDNTGNNTTTQDTSTGGVNSSNIEETVYRDTNRERTENVLNSDIHTSNENHFDAPLPWFRKQNIPPQFMTSPDILQQCQSIIDQLITEGNTQDKIDSLYLEIVDMYVQEMKRFPKQLSKMPKSKQAFRHSKKPFWSEELGQMWKLYHDAEKKYVKCPRNQFALRALKEEFKRAEDSFDKALRHAKCSHQ